MRAIRFGQAAVGNERRPYYRGIAIAFLYDYVTNTYEYDYPGVYATDDYGVPLALYDASPITFGADQMSLYALSSEVMETTTGNNVWEYEYAKIFNANTIIASVGSVNGSQEEKTRRCAMPI